ncbi:hypothetical protein PQE75_gp073 [Bacillus phage vB_BcoS-136]|uniref:Uncharacterized protein n=1 Tax=Bacillus phage vB_BcoS-136 TaxID=2419619 RepID=A0A3G3BVD1_9CAUD|nr:hypothetical protein PQE75_gp073 [Bacillus phage vB_BcoS-136]AYP68205.1 hypothetical protein vBBcoS136_00073 [Bacillus phage vB_BcoS-136]
MKCPNCESKDVYAKVLAHGYVNVSMQSGEIEEQPDDCDYDVNDLMDFGCHNCHHEWEDLVVDLDELVRKWEAWRENYYKKLNARIVGTQKVRY